jgi:hypothetical protein
MTTIVTRIDKGTALTHVEMDANFTNLNEDKIEKVATATENNLAIFDSGGAVQDDATDALRTVANLLMPVGTQYTNFTDSRNPDIIFNMGGTTWVAVEGRVVVGVGTTTDSRSEVRAFAAAEEDGEFNHALSAAENGPHDHDLVLYQFTGAVTNDNPTNTNGNATIGTATTETSGSGSAHNNVQPYTTAYVWKRTA